MADAGFDKTRIVLQQWNRNFRPSQMRLDGRIPDVFMVSSMSLHSERCMELIRDAHRIDPAHRPLIIAGGPHAVYEPYDLFSADPARPGSADVVVTGEEFVLLSLIEVVLSMRGRGESMRSAFVRARDSGALDDDPRPGLFARRAGTAFPRNWSTPACSASSAISTNCPTRCSATGCWSRRAGTRRSARARCRSSRCSKRSPISSLVLTFGCKFACPYCPIPAYNQRQYRVKSGERIADEMFRLNKEYGLRFFFGADDNFFNDKARTLDIVETLARAEFDGVKLRDRARWYTEVTVHDTLQMKEHLPLVRESGCRALWLGVEDLTATLVKKGQSADKTTEAFRALRDAGICPMPMMMHHDSQPLYSRGSNYGLLNQVELLRRAGAVSLQVLMITPAVGSKLLESTYTSGQVFKSVGGRAVRPHMCDGNYVVASNHKRPWQKQLTMLAGYLYFYNPVWLVVALIRSKTPVAKKPAYLQIFGMMGLVMTIVRTSGWAVRLMFGRIERHSRPPASRIPMRGVDGAPASHDTSATPNEVQRPLVRHPARPREMAAP